LGISIIADEKIPKPSFHPFEFELTPSEVRRHHPHRDAIAHVNLAI
jgi:hypothetical protein